MANPDLLGLVSPVIDLITLAITATSAAYVARQQASEYNQVKGSLVTVHLFYIALVTLEFIRNFYSTPSFMEVYTIGNTTFVLLDVALLTVVALAIYYKPKGPGLASIVNELSGHGSQLLFFLLFCAYLAFAEVVLLIYRPFSLVVLENMVGKMVNSTVFSSYYLDILLGVLLVFILYPSTLLFLSSRRTVDPLVKRALIILPIAWIGIGLVILVFNGYVLTVEKVDDSAIAYLLAATAFSASASVFRRATLLSGFFTEVSAPPLQPNLRRERPFSRRIGVEMSSLIGKEMLIEVDPTADYEQLARDLALEFSAGGYAVFAFTSIGSPIYASLSTIEGVRFFVLTEKVSYPRGGAEQNEMLVPRYDQSVLLSVVDKTLSSNPQLKMLIIFDELTDEILSVGLEPTYKFIKQANELLSVASTTAVFFLTTSAQGTKETNVVRGLFTEQLLYGVEGLKVTSASRRNGPP